MIKKFVIRTGCKDFSRVDVEFFLPVGGAMEDLELLLLHQKEISPINACQISSSLNEVKGVKIGSKYA